MGIAKLAACTAGFLVKTCSWRAPLRTPFDAPKVRAAHGAIAPIVGRAPAATPTRFNNPTFSSSSK